MAEVRPGPGRPRERGIDLSIVRATRELLSERGHSGLTLDAVAARADVRKAASRSRTGSATRFARRRQSLETWFFTAFCRRSSSACPWAWGLRSSWTARSARAAWSPRGAAATPRGQRSCLNRADCVSLYCKLGSRSPPHFRASTRVRGGRSWWNQPGIWRSTRTGQPPLE